MTLRLFRFHPTRVAFDQVMRETVLPDLAASPGVRTVCAGRQGPDELGARVVASVWDSAEAMRAVMGEDLEHLRFHPELMPETRDHALEVLPVLLATAELTSLRTGILRLARGRMGPSGLARYVEDVQAGVEADRRAGHGPASLVLATADERSFVTLTCWSDWPAVERATGTTMDRPIHTQRLEDLESFSVEHLELLPIGP